MIKLLLPKMLEKKRGIIVNVSSVAGTMNVAMMSVYSATKVTFNNSCVMGLQDMYMYMYVPWVYTPNSRFIMALLIGIPMVTW